VTAIPYKITDPFHEVSDTPYSEYIHRISNSEYYTSSIKYIGMLKYLHSDIKDDMILRCAIIIRTAALLKEMSDDNIINTCMGICGTYIAMSLIDGENTRDCHGNSILHYAASYGLSEEKLYGILDICNDRLLSEGVIKESVPYKYILNHGGLSPVDIISKRGGLYPLTEQE
jgi:hypothetical protein